MDALEYELESTTTPRTPAVIHKKKGGFFGKIIALLLGLILGFIACIGAIAGIAYYVFGIATIKDLEAYLKSALGDEFTYTDYVDETYGDSTLLVLLQASMGALSSVTTGDGTLNTINDIYPFVYSFIAGTENKEGELEGGIVDMLAQYGIELDPDVMMGLRVNGSGGEDLLPDVYLTDYIMDTVYTTPIGDIMQSMGSSIDNPILVGLFYGVEGKDFRINEKTHQKEFIEGGTPWITLNDLLFAETDIIGERVGHLTVDSVLNITASDTTTLLLAYGPSYCYNTNSDGTFHSMRQRSFQVTNPSAGEGEFVFTDGSGEVATYITYVDGKYQAAVDGETFYLGKDVGDPTRYNAYLDAACTEPAMYKKKTVSDLSDGSLLANITIGELLSVTPEDNILLQKLKGSTLNSLATDISNLTFGDLFAEEIYKDGNPENNDPNNVKSVWKYLLKDPTTNEIRHDYKLLDNMNTLVNNMTANMQTATLSELHADGIIALTDTDFLQQTAKRNFTFYKTNFLGEEIKIDCTDVIPNDTTLIGDLTVSQLFSYLSKIYTGLNKL